MNRATMSVHDTQSTKLDHLDSHVPVGLPGASALGVLRELQQWGNVVTIVLHGGSVFEFKGPFPEGEESSGYYNLGGPVPGFHGHLKLSAIDYIGFQARPHAGRPAYALTFNSVSHGNIFKVFLGRDTNGEVYDEQLQRFTELKRIAVPLNTLQEMAE